MVDPRRVSLDYSVAHNREAVANCLGKPARWEEGGLGRAHGSNKIQVKPSLRYYINESNSACISMFIDSDVSGVVISAKPKAPVDVENEH